MSGEQRERRETQHGRTTKGSPWLRTALVEAALGATRPTGYLRSQYWRVPASRDRRRASMLEIIHQLMTTGELYTDLGGEFLIGSRPV